MKKALTLNPHQTLPKILHVPFHPSTSVLLDNQLSGKKLKTKKNLLRHKQKTPIVHGTPSKTRTTSIVNMPTIATTTTTTTPPHDKELCLNTPPHFKGDQTKLRKFIQDCKIYLAINKRTYTDDEAKCAFILSYMEGGEADAWKDQYISSITDKTTGNIKFETTDVLIKRLLDSFNKSQQQENTLHCLTQLRQGKGAVEEHNIKFNLVSDQTKLNNNNNHMFIDVYKKSQYRSKDY